jgi:hypothetical protein
MNISDHKESINFIKGSPRRFLIRSTIQHWQLRDLVLCPLSKKQFVYVNQNTVNFFDTEKQSSFPAFKDLSFSPTSIASKYLFKN